MIQKEILTNKEIEKDIITALKNPPRESEASYKKWTVPAIIIALILFIIEFIYPIFILWFLGVLIIFFTIAVTVHYIRLKRKIKRISINDYDITNDTVRCIDEEHYIKKSYRYRSEAIHNYIISFESGKTWRIPKDNYSWSERRMSDFAIYHSTHRGDTMITVIKKEKSEVVMAYHPDFFEYKN